MKKNGKKPGGVGGVRSGCSGNKPGDVGQVKNACTCGKTAESDKTDGSSNAKDLMYVKNLLDNVSEIRSEMVIRLKAEVESGSYYVDAGKVAEKMIEKALRNAINSKKV
jgi:negative regulator of flagellin synthesis FlgM